MFSSKKLETKIKISGLAILLVLNNFAFLPIARAQELSPESSTESLQVPIRTTLPAPVIGEPIELEPILEPIVPTPVLEPVIPDPVVEEPVVEEPTVPEIAPEPEEPIVPDQESLLAGEGDGQPYYLQKDDIPAIADKLNIETDVSSGALVYSYPLEIPAGRNGLQPNLKLIYNNQDGNNQNIFGFGWSINIPYIERIAKEGVDKLYTTNYFNSSLTGELVEISSGNYASRVENGEYFNYQYNSSNNFWTVKDKMGTVYTFGPSADSRQDDLNNASHIYKWMLQETRDTNDNFIRYEYFKDSGQIYPRYIYYTGHGTTDGIFKIEFLSESRNDNPDNFQTGFNVNTNFRISEIKIYINNEWKNKYNLTYTIGDNGFHSLLHDITKFGLDTENNVVALPAEKIKYQSKNKTWQLDNNFILNLSFVNQYGHDAGSRIADINGDGLADLMISRSDPAPEGTKVVYINNGDGTGWTYDANYTIPMFFSNGYGTDYGVRLDDVDGDGFTDMIEGNSTSGKVYINNGDGTGWVYDSGYTLPCFFIQFDVYGNKDTGCRLADANGDGLTDFVYSPYGGGGGIYINKGDGSGWAIDTNYQAPPPFVDLWGQDAGDHIVDINGDRLDDIVISRSNPAPEGIKLVYINKGDGTGWTYDANYIIPTFFSNGHGTDYGARLLDVNGDGLSDIILANSNGRAVYINNGDGTGWTYDSGYTLPCFFIQFDVYGDKDTGCRLADANGDGLVDFLYSPYGGGGGVYLSSPSKTDVLSEIKHDAGAVTNITYKGSAQYLDSNGDLLNPDLPFTMQTVNQLVIDDGLGGVSTTTYQYGGGEMYFNTPFDKKFASFGKIIKTDSDNKIVSYYHQNNGLNSSSGELSDSYAQIGKPYKLEIRDKDTDGLLQVDNTIWETTALSSGRQLVLNTQKVRTDLSGVNLVSTAEQMDYDSANGNLLTKENLGKVTADTNTGEILDTLSGDEKNTDYQYAENSIKHILAAPKNQEISNLSENKDQDLYYDNLPLGSVEKVNLTKEDYKIDQVKIEREFNNLGLVTHELDPKGATTTIAYDANNLYPSSKTDPLNQVTLTEYNLFNGKLASSTDSNNQRLVNSFDGFGRVTEVLKSDPENSSNLINNQEIIYYDKSTVYESTSEMIADADTIALWHTNGQIASVEKKSNAEGTSSYDLTEHNMSSAVAGFNGAENGAYQFTRASSRYLTAPDANELDLNFDFTIEAWIKFDSLPQNDEFYTIINKNDNATQKQYAIGYRNDASGLGYSGTYVFISSNGSKSVINDSHLWEWPEPPQVGQWYYLVVTYNKTAGRVEVFVDGESLGGVTGFPVEVYNGTDDFDIGALNSLSAWNGSIDEIKVSGKVRSNQEIYNYFNFGNYIPSQYPTEGDFRFKETKDYFTATQYSTSRAYYDGLDRVVQKKSQQAGNQWTTLDIVYDARGRVVRQSLPYDTATLDYTMPDLAKPAKTYTYDALDRVLTETNPTGTTHYEYDGFTTKITDANGVLKELTKDAYGNLIQVKEHNDTNVYTTNYEYTLTNKLKKITDSAGNIRNFSYDALDNLTWQDMVHKPSVTTPAKIQYTYDKNGNVLTEASFKGDAISYVYDNLNRVLYEKLSGVNKISYTYDTGTYNKGKLVLANYNDGNSQTYNYDILGRLTTATTTISNEPFVLKYEYNTAGALSKVTYPNNYQVTYGFNNIGQVSSLTLTTSTSTQNIATNITYNQNGQMTHLERNNDVITDYTYDPYQAFRLTRILTTSGQDTLQDLNYTYDPVGNILAITDNANTDLKKSATYTYDDLNRLLSATVTYTNHPDKNYTQTFTYDSIGNMITNSDLGTLNYNNGQPHQLSSYGTRNFQYDTAGNMTRNGGINKFLWDYRNRLSVSNDIASNNDTYYLYDHNNQRFLKYTQDYVFIPLDPGEEGGRGGSRNVISLPDSGEMALDGGIGGHWEWQTVSLDKYVDKYFEENLNDQTKSHIYLNNIKIATVNNTDNPYYVLSDNLDSNSILTDNTGSLDQSTDYKPFGEIVYNNTITDLKNDYKHTGKELDEETSLQYYGARYYDNKLGKFTSIEPVMLVLYDGNRVKTISGQELKEILSDPQVLHSYAYAKNNPVILVDVDGNWWKEFIWDNIVTLGHGQSASSFQVELGQAANQLYNDSGTWKVAMDHPYALAAAGSAPLLMYLGLGLLADTNVAASVNTQADKANDVLDEVMPKLLNPPINITESGLNHIINEHTVKGLETEGNSIFNQGENITDLIRQGTQQVIEKQSFGYNFQRIFDVGRNIGIDRSTNQMTRIMTIITDKLGNLITAFPGKP